MTSLHSPLANTLALAVHELRTPVTVAIGYLRMLLKEQGGPLTDTQKKMLEEAERSCRRISALVSDMSDLATIEAGEVPLGEQEIDVAALLTSTASELHEGENRGVTLEVRGADHPFVVGGDRQRLGAALQALLHAALRERGEAGPIIVQCARSAAPLPQLRIAIGDEDAQRELTALFAASDGASEGGASAGAEPFGAPFDEYRGGMGFALLIARRTIAAHGGELWCVPGRGQRAGCALLLPLRT